MIPYNSWMAEAALDVPPCGCAAPGAALASTCYCSVEDLMRVLRRRYSLALMNAIHQHQPARFHQLSAVLPQASTSTLSETLAVLETAQLVVHHTAEVAPTSTYTLSASGDKLLSRLRRLLEDIQQ
jgi:DNA-binding HxlR family transcriptional regulator